VGPEISSRELMINTSSFLMNHGFMFDHSEGLALTSWDKDTLSPFVVSKDYEVLWEAFANVFGGTRVMFSGMSSRLCKAGSCSTGFGGTVVEMV
jgi:hypothetical protein